MSFRKTSKYISLVFFSILPLIYFFAFPNYNSIVEVEAVGIWGAFVFLPYVFLYEHFGRFFSMIIVYAFLLSIYFLSRRKIKS
jgi:hypothetical protein